MLRAHCIAAHTALYCGVSAEETKQFWKYRKEALWSAMSQYPDRDPMVRYIHTYTYINKFTHLHLVIHTVHISHSYIYFLNIVHDIR